MNTLNITSSITFNEVEAAQLITSNNFSTYNFISCSICIEINVNNETYEATLQTGHSYYQGNYSLPSNTLSVYEGTALLEQLDSVCEKDLDDEQQVEYINEQSDTSYTKEQLIAIYSELNEIIGEAQQIVNDAEREADEALEADDNVYVLVTEFEMVETDDDQYEKRQCAENYIKTFNDEESAEKFIESFDHLTYARIVDKEIGVELLQAQR